MFPSLLLKFSQVVLRAKGYTAWRLETFRYTFPNLLLPAVPLSEKARRALATFQREGIFRLEEERFSKIADHLDSTYFLPLEAGKDISQLQLPNPECFTLDTNKPSYREAGTQINVNVSFKDPHLMALFFDPELTGVLYNYYRRQPWYRNQPLLQKICFDGRVPALTNSGWHVDYLHQISFMLLVSDVSLADTHMQYALGSHKRVWPVGNYPQELVQKQGFPVVNVIGKKGTLFVFDAGGIHRACYQAGTARKILHINVTTGHHLSSQKFDRLDPWPELSQVPWYARRMVKRIGR